jgi:type IV pilus assembly protein PilV
MNPLRKVVAHGAASESGSVLLEGLFAILIFSIGILALIGLQMSAVRQSTDAKYRAEASLLANELVGQMWASPRAQAQLKTNYEAGGTAFGAWSARVASLLPGITASANQPAVTVDSNSVVTVTVSWQQPGQSVSHQFVMVAQIK